MALYRIRIRVKEVKGFCPLYKPGDEIILDGYYINAKESNTPICMHAFLAIASLLSAFSHGASARDLGIGEKENIGYLQCPDPGPPHTKGGTVLFELIREKPLSNH